DVCHCMPTWGAELAGWGDHPDHVWSTDTGRAKPLAAATVRRRAAAARSYYRWHYAQGLTACSPADIWTPRASGIRAEPAVRDTVEDLDRDDLGRLQVAADQHDGVDGDRELASAVIAVLIDTACRSVELARLDVTD